MLPRIISSIGLVLLVLSVVVVSGCTSSDALDNVYKTESDGLKHYEGEGISFNSLNNWTYYKLESNASDYLFSIGRGTGEEMDLIHFHSSKYNGTLAEHINSLKKEITSQNGAIISERELTVDGVPSYQISVLNPENKPFSKTWFMKNGSLYTIHAVPGPNRNLTDIEKDLEIVINSFHIL